MGYFRPDFQALYKIRTLLGGTDRCTTLALTATASTKGQRDIIDGRKMSNVLKIVQSPIRANISLEVLQR